MDDHALAVGCTFMIVWNIIFFVVIIIVGGSFRTEVTYVPQGVSSTVKQTSFEESFTARHWLGALIKGEQPDLQGSLSKYVRQGEQITRITIVTKHTWSDLLITLVTIGIYCPQTVTVQGTVNTP